MTCVLLTGFDILINGSMQSFNLTLFSVLFMKFRKPIQTGDNFHHQVTRPVDKVTAENVIK